MQSFKFVSYSSDSFSKAIKLSACNYLTKYIFKEICDIAEGFLK